MLLDSLYIPGVAWSARARNSRGTCARTDNSLIWLVGVKFYRESTSWKLCTCKLRPIVSVFPSLSFFLESPLPLAFPGRLSATGAPSIVVDSMQMLRRRLVPRLHAALEYVLKTWRLEWRGGSWTGWRWVKWKNREKEKEEKKEGRETCGPDSREPGPRDQGRRKGVVNSPVSLGSC